MNSFLQLGSLFASLVLTALAAPLNQTFDLETRANAGERLVFAHFMIGITAPRNSRDDYDADMKRAKEVGIDAFALNIADPAKNSYTEKQLDLAYDSAAVNDMKVFISFDFHYFDPVNGAASQVGAMIKKYAAKSAQLNIGDKAFVSSFIGDGTESNGPLDIQAMKNAAGIPLYFAPNFAPWYTPNPAQIDAAFNWMGWISDGYNNPPRPGQTKTIEDGDREYKNWLGSKPYMAPISPWFFTHYTDGSYPKNWVMPGNLAYFDRWNKILRTSPEYLQIVSWNDYGESHYVGPLSSKHGDDGNSKWVNDMPHDAWLDMAKPYIAAYKARATSPNSYITQDQIIYWYRPTPTSINCDSTDPQGPRPNGWDIYEDSVFVVSLLTQAGTITVTSGNKAPVSYNAPAGAHARKIPVGVGAQKFDLSRSGKSVISGISPKDISNTCPCGINNWNAFVGQIPFVPFGTLDPTGLERFAENLRVSTCKAVPTLDGKTPGDGGGGSGGGGGGDGGGGGNPGPTPTPNPVPNPNPSNCNGGTSRSDVSGNFKGLCEFSCARNYCPDVVCVCTGTGAPRPTLWNKAPGCPAAGLGSEYDGLCSFGCANDYCPESACTRGNCPR